MTLHTNAYRYFRALCAAAQAVTSSLEVEQVLDQLTTTTVGVLGIKACAIRLLSDDGATLALRASHGLSRRYLLKGPVGPHQSPLDQEALQDRVVIVPDVATDPRFQYPEEARREGLVSLLCVPLRAHGAAIGVMRAYTATPHTFSDLEQEFVQSLADLGALALVNARTFQALRADYHDVVDSLWGPSLAPAH